MRMHTRTVSHHQSTDHPSESRLGYYFLLIVLPLGLAHLAQSLVPVTHSPQSIFLSVLTVCAIGLFSILGSRTEGSPKTTFFSYALFLVVSLLSTFAMPLI
ncbi:hypothetical protein [Exiguobacterium antarcticum]|uniref:hypothetical protein n=1 Tax=Exiguobacterium antarcticum TaxID=132920 RepID=UPI0004799EFF|nr:hypothetical protein [Exiguobacterium antarcticum]